MARSTRIFIHGSAEDACIARAMLVLPDRGAPLRITIWPGAVIAAPRGIASPSSERRLLVQRDSPTVVIPDVGGRHHRPVRRTLANRYRAVSQQGRGLAELDQPWVLDPVLRPWIRGGNRVEALGPVEHRAREHHRGVGRENPVVERATARARQRLPAAMLEIDEGFEKGHEGAPASTPA